MKKSARNGLLILFGLTIFGAFILFLLTTIWGLGYMTPWQKIILPERVASVLASDALVTSSGQIYQYNPYYDPYSSKNGWEKVDSLITPQYPVSILRLEECGWIPSTKYFLDSKITCAEYGPGTITKILAIDERGNAFYWQHPQVEPDNSLLAIAPCIGAILGLGFGVIILCVVWISPKMKRILKTNN